MSESEIQNLLDDLFKKKIEKTFSSGGGSYKTEIIDKDVRILVEQIIRKHLLDNHDERIGVLEAKVFAYEKIISNSNFGPILKPEQLNEDNK